MTEQLCWGTTRDLIKIVSELTYPPETLMILERVPTSFLSDAERKNSICLRKYNPDENFETWERGRIFHNDFELRWEKHNADFVIVYIGESKTLTLPHIKLLSGVESHDVSYYLWGERMTADTLKSIDQPDAENLFLELQIPRLLSYPVSNQQDKLRVKLSARHYLNSETGTLEFYRFRYLEEV